MLKIRFTNIFVLRVFEILNRRLKHNNKLNQFYIIYDVVLILSINFLKNKDQDIDDRINTLIKKLNECLIRLKIIKMKFIRNNVFNQIIVAIDINF